MLGGGAEEVEEGRAAMSEPITFVQAYLSGWFCNYRCPCGFWFGPDGIKDALIHFNRGHYK